MATAKPFILFITGASTVGKTSLFGSLSQDPAFEHTVFHDVDENGVPKVGRRPWRQYRVEELLAEAVRQLLGGRSSIICGMVFPHEVIDSKTYRPDLNLHFLALVTTRELIRGRLSDRIANNGDGQRFDEDFQEKTILESFDVQRLILHQTASLRSGHMIDASQLSLETLHDQAKRLISQLG